MCDLIPYNTRSTVNMDVYVPGFNYAQYKTSFAYNGPVIWNGLPDYAKESSNLKQFKANYRRYQADSKI